MQQKEPITAKPTEISGSTRADPGRLAQKSSRLSFFGNAFASFMYLDYRWYWYSNLAAFMAMQMQMVTRGWLIYEMTQSPVALALVVVSFGIPMTMLSLIGGALADRLPKRTMISIAQGINAISGFAIALLVFSNVIELWHLLVSGVVNGVLIAMSMPSR